MFYLINSLLDKLYPKKNYQKPSNKHFFSYKMAAAIVIADILLWIYLHNTQKRQFSLFFFFLFVSNKLVLCLVALCFVSFSFKSSTLYTTYKYTLIDGGCVCVYETAYALLLKYIPSFQKRIFDFRLEMVALLTCCTLYYILYWTSILNNNSRCTLLWSCI